MLVRSLIGLLLVTASLSGCDAPPSADTQKPATPQPGAAGVIDRSQSGKAGPTVRFEAQGGKTLSLADFRGTPVLVNLWATWCAPCVTEMPAIDRLAKRAGGRLMILPISEDMEGWKAVNGFFKPGRFAALTPYLDQPTDFALAVGATGLPVNILYDAEGREVWRVNGPLEWDDPRVARELGLAR